MATEPSEFGGFLDYSALTPEDETHICIIMRRVICRFDPLQGNSFHAPGALEGAIWMREANCLEVC